MTSGGNRPPLLVRDADPCRDARDHDELRNFLKIINNYVGDDPLQPWLRCLKWVKSSLPAGVVSSVYWELLDQCTKTFSKEARYCSDTRFLQVWIQLADCGHVDPGCIFKRMEALQIGQDCSLFYGAYAIFHEAQGSLLKAHQMYQLGITRQAKPVKLLEKAYKEFIKRVAYQILPKATRKVPSLQKSGMLSLALQASIPVAQRSVQSHQIDQRDFLSPSEKKSFCDTEWPASKVNPWDDETIERLLNGLKPPLGLYMHHRKFAGPSIKTLRHASHNNILELGTTQYRLKGYTGEGAFAQVFKACDDQNKETVVVLKIQKPPCPWEYYIYSQLNKHLPKEERSSFGHASEMHIYDDCSVMVCSYGERGTLQDVVNSYLANGQKMDELLCMYYTVEMLRMLEVLHSTGIIHGDFKPDNLLMRNTSEIPDDWAPDRPGNWIHQGLCLIDWGRSIDLNLFPLGTMLEGDCQTSGFQCVEMQQQKPWTFQVDTYGLCCTVHVMLHGCYMDIEAVDHFDMSQSFHPKIPFKRYQKGELWRELFSKLLNVKSCQDNPSLCQLRKLFESFLTSNMQYGKKIRELMLRQSKVMYPRH